jgi:anti-sigma regulatory factor (Ser/Thr protein kinase)
VTVIAGAITECLRQGKKVQYRRPREDQVERWLSSISFSRLFHIDEMSAATRSTSTELRLLTSLDPIYIDDLVNLLDANMNLSTGVRDSIKMSVQELLTNVFDHSNSTVGCFVCAQFTPKSQRIRLSVTDFGIGILKALKSVKIYSGLRTSHEAITRAVEEGVSSRQGKTAGFGLTHIRRFMRVNQGTMTVISGDGKVNFYEKSIERRPMPSHFTGTAIELKISADKGGFYFLTDENIF